ncbi:hypothetical protein DEO72_LG11g2181 [Vigna unguiculata]|uniref:Uncharacterized protein n=1 Tax=Vigna unguiculata TaxID=3917 RepID=A0A4D6NQC6_VIGUN|nr:hypothetical protein DEO72_LG11g2181 [Vigna unguiculata]
MCIRDRAGSWQRLAARVPRQAIRTAAALNLDCVCAVSYTHLDVYKRQGWKLAAPGGTCPPPGDSHCCSFEFGLCRVPIYEHSPYRPKPTKLVSQQLRRAIYLDPSVLATTSTLIPPTLANPSHNSRCLVFIRHPEPQLKRCYSEPQLKEYHVLTPYPEPQLKGYQCESPDGGHVPPGAASFQTAWRVSRTARRTVPFKLFTQQRPPGGTASAARRTKP